MNTTVRVTAIGCLIAVAGCSADVSRFDSPFFGFNDSSATGQPAPRPAAGLGRQTALADQAPDTGAAPPSTAPRTAKIDVAALPAPASTPATTVAPVAKSAPVRPVSVSTQPTPVTTGQTIEVQTGDTLFGLARRHGVSIADLQAANGLQSAMLKPGQKLVLPASAKRGVTRTAGATIVASADASAPAATAPRPQAGNAAPAATTADASGGHTVRPGDSLYAIAKANKVKVGDLMQANGIADAKQLKPGMVLKIPGAATPVPPVTKVAGPPAAPTGAVVPAVTVAAPVVPVAPAPALEKPAPLAGKPRILNGDAAASPVVPQPVSTAATSTAKFRWPVQGKVASAFGPRPDGSNNDGIDILVPAGTEVLAAEAGTVAYTGDGIPSFGNLVLLRHDNGFVTAYAHNDQVLVKRGDKVRRGQAIAKAGKSGQADQPMLHFEVRQGQTPVDPMPHMEKL